MNTTSASPATAKSLIQTLTLALAVFFTTATGSFAEQFGDFTYYVEEGTVMITDYPVEAVGEVEIPAEIDGKPVRGIYRQTFWECRLITDIAFPASVTEIDPGAFDGCTSLKSITVAPENPSYSDVDGVLLDAEQTTLILCPRAKSGIFTIPDTVTQIETYYYRWEGGSAAGYHGFGGCSRLEGLVIPASLQSLPTSEEGRWLWGCTGLTTVILSEGISEIGPYALWGCTSLKTVTLPSSVTSVNTMAFGGCQSLEEILVASGNSHFASCSGLLLDDSKTTLLICPEGKTGTVTVPPSVTVIGRNSFSNCTRLSRTIIPSSVTSIGRSAFWNCTRLSSTTIPASVTSIDRNAFIDCTAMTNAIFLGDAPTEFGRNAFLRPADTFTVYYLKDNTGFASPVWNGYPAFEIDVTSHPYAPWLLSHNLPFDTDLHQDLNGDGVTLLAAYALNLDPGKNSSTRLPVPILTGEALQLTYYAASPGIRYSVETSKDLHHWTTEGVTLSSPDPEGQVTASIPRDSPRQFLRLVVAEQLAP